mmetsp:Transcript_18945/g.30966  ORF Transcript_18945/g.30966 Transcript_18945/m.30966 type:complete len:84 (+) Transcript_18945:136-387(+)
MRNLQRKANNANGCSQIALARPQVRSEPVLHSKQTCQASIYHFCNQTKQHRKTELQNRIAQTVTISWVCLVSKLSVGERCSFV